MIYLTGVTNDKQEPHLIAAGVGLMVQPGSGYARRVLRYPAWAADNACYANRFDEDKWIDWLYKLPNDGCLFAVAPDVYPDAEASLERGRPFFGIIREMGKPVAVVAQDGAENIDYPWDEFDCLFIGGKRTEDPRQEWKISEAAEGLAHRARNLGKWVHMGRVNSWKRVERAREMGCLSVDGTRLKYQPTVNFGALDAWAWRAVNQLTLPITVLETPSLAAHRLADAAKGEK